jgi:flagellar biosynthesis/type III secretory pathway protein FliH
VQEALGAVEDGELRLYANPADHDALAAALAGHADITLQTDPSLQPGEARLRGRWASVDFTRGAALTAVREALS